MSAGNDPEPEASSQAQFIPTPKSGKPLPEDTQAGIKAHEGYVLMGTGLS